MRHAILLVGLLALGGCEKKKATEPVSIDHRKTVVAPTRAHLDDYVAQLPGSGSGLVARIETNLGAITCQLWPDRAPMTVANFIGLATGQKAWKNPMNGNIEVGKPYYDGLTFHRVIPGFMIQGGDPLGKGSGGPGYSFADEVSPADRMEPGVLAMANSGPGPGGAGTNGSQFFITDGAPDWLNGKHTIFGKCGDANVVKAITEVKKIGESTPESPVTMTKVTITKA